MHQRSLIVAKPPISCESDNKSSQTAQCSCLKKFHELLGQMFHKLGYSFAKYPYYFIIVPFCITLISITGVRKLIFINEPDDLYCPTNAKAWQERNVTESLFPLNYSNGFDPSRIINFSSYARLLISAKDNQSMFRTHVWNNVMEADGAIRGLDISFEGSLYDYQDVCAKFNEECTNNDILKLDEIMIDIEAGITAVNYPIMLFPLILPFFYGEIELNETEGVIMSVKSVSLTYWFKDGTSEEKARAELFEQRILQYLNDDEFENITIAYTTSISLRDEIDKNASSLIPYLFPTILIILFITTIFMLELDWVRSKIHLGLIGITTTGLAIGCGFGILMYCKVPFTSITLVSPFLLLGIGLDDMFVLISAWRRTDVTSDVSTRLANTYSEAAFSVTITSLTNMVSFLIGATSPFPSVSLFCIYAGFTIFITYIYFITFFGGCLALAGFQEQHQRHAITFKVVKAKSEADADDKTTCFSIWCTGGINKNDPHNPKDNKPFILMTFFKTHLAYVLKNSINKALILGIFILYITGAIYGILHIEEGMEYKNLVLDDSYLVNYFTVEAAQFKTFPHRIQVIITEPITYSDPEVKKQLLELHSTFENLSYIGPSLYTESWIRRFYNYLERRPALSANITDEVSFIKVLKEHFLVPEIRDYLDVVISEDETQILASRFIIQDYKIRNAIEEKDMMTAVRKVAQNAPFEVVTNCPFFLFYDQYLAIRSAVLQTIAIVAAAMMMISLVFIPNPICSLWVTFSILSIITGVMGYMSLWGVKLDGISMINLIMCVGFSVDFSAHISYAYLTAKANSPNGRIEESLYNLGLPVIQSGVSTIAGTILFSVSPSYIKLTFFKIILLVIIFGTLHALFLLPVLLSILGPDTCKKSSTNERKFTENTTNFIWSNIKIMHWRQNKVHTVTRESGETINNMQDKDIKNCQPIFMITKVEDVI